MIYAFISIGSRLLLSTGMFFFVANFLSEVQYGHFAIHSAYGIILGQLFEFGAQNRIIKETSKNVENEHKNIYIAITNKLLILPVILILYYILSQNQIIIKDMFAYITIFYLENSVLEIFLCTMRSKNKAKEEALSILTINLGILSFSLPILYFYGIILFTKALVLSRTVFIFILAIKYKTYNFLYTKKVTEIKINFIKSLYYAIDTLLINISPNLNIIIISYNLNTSIVGQYQLFQKLIQGFNTLSMCATQRYMPLLAKNINTANYLTIKKKYIYKNIILFTIPLTTYLFLYIFDLYKVIGITKENSKYFWILAGITLFRYVSATEGVDIILRKGAKIRAKIATLICLTNIILLYIFTKIRPDITTLLGIEIGTTLLLLVLYYQKNNEKNHRQDC